MANRTNTFLIKRSNVPGKVPSAGDLILGELALNTADVKLYASGTTANSIIPIGWDRVAITGDTMTGTLYLPTISATTYLNLPVDVRVTGGTFNPATSTITFTNNTGGTFNVSGITVSSSSSSFTGGTVTGATRFTNGLTANTISATTYLNLPTDIRVTAFTYSNNTLTIRDNTGSTFTSVINTMTGLTINGSTQLNGGISSSNLSGSTDRVIEVSSGGTFSASRQIISAYISSASTQAALLINVSNWDINGVYIGSAITGTYQGQRYYDNNYFFEAIDDNVWIRLIRG